MSLWDHVGNILESLWEHFEVTLKTFWDHFGYILGSLLEHFEITFGTFWDHLWELLLFFKLGVNNNGRLLATVFFLIFFENQNSTNKPS